ncbi:MFS transporter [Histophilus somni]|uniref:MFS transporter n=1 Tax=Histophilus somni TaxID=731 RepID=UPI00201F0BB5|nr:MFS transporter [Histophilus somni]
MTIQPDPTSVKTHFQGNDKLLFGMIMGVIAFWLFAQTTLNIAPDMEQDLGVNTSIMNIAVSITALFSGMFIVVMGGFADRIGCLKILNLGFLLSIIGALLIALAPSGDLAVPLLMLGRIIQGISAACIMPSSLALVKAYWEGEARQRAISMWSIGSWGGSGLCALFGGLVSQNLGWRYIFFACAALSLLGYVMCRGTPEFKMEDDGKKHKFDWGGVVTFMIAMIALQVLVTQGGDFGWTSMTTISLLLVTFVSIVLFLWIEERADKAFVDFSLFKNATYTGATISNFLLNGVAGMLIVSLQLVQLGGNMTAQSAGLLTIGYAIAIIAFIRVGEKLLQRFGARTPMIWGCLITGFSIALLLPTNMMLDQYKIIVVISYILFGIGLAFYATPSTDAALSNLPPEQAGAGSGLYKMASSLGAAFGVAISAAIFTALRAENASVSWLNNIVPFVGRQDNIAIREAATIALMFNLLMILGAIVSIMLTVPTGKKSS